MQRLNYCFVCLHVMGLSRFGSSKGETQGGSCTSALRPMREHITDSVATCIQVLDWMDRHEDRLSSIGLDSRQRTRTAPRPSTRNSVSWSTTNCKKVLEWMDSHEGNLPVRLSNPITDVQRAGALLRRKFNYLKGKMGLPPEARVLLEQIESRTSFVAGTTTCKRVLDWMYGHDMALPKEFRKATTDAQRAEYFLRNQFKYLKRKTHHPPEVLELLDKIKRLSLLGRDFQQFCVAPWCPSSYDKESCELPVIKRRRLLVKTKAPSLL
jgi:hypothetical protein